MGPAGQLPPNPMPTLIDKILREYVEEACQHARLGRNGGCPGRNLVSAEVLAELEASGDAMRFVDAKGRVAWKASPNLRDHLKDLEADAEDDFADI
jgi:hypothetical protein